MIGDGEDALQARKNLLLHYSAGLSGATCPARPPILARLSHLMIVMIVMTMPMNSDDDGDNDDIFFRRCHFDLVHDFVHFESTFL